MKIRGNQMEKLTLYRKPFSGDPAKDRHKFIGGSDAGTIMNVNPWKSQYELWLEKTGQLEPDDISDKLQVWFGTEEEEIVAKRFCLETGKSVRRSNMTYLCKEYPFLAGHVDRMVVGENAGLECKQRRHGIRRRIRMERYHHSTTGSVCIT